MRKVLLFCILVSLSVLPAKERLLVALYPKEQRYVISAWQQDPRKAWEGQLTFVRDETLTIVLPSRFSFEGGGSSLRFGYAGFWQEYALLPFFVREQALLLTRGGDALMALRGGEKRRAVGYEHSFSKAKLSLLAWTASVQTPTSYQVKWGALHSPWGFAGKAVLESSGFALHTEALFTPIQGLEGFFSSSFRHGSSTFLFAYGQDPYPVRYSFALDVEGRGVQVTFSMEDGFGGEPIYGGHSAIRRRKQGGAVKLFLPTGYLLFSASDTYEFKQRGTEVGSVVLKATWKGAFGHVSFSCTQKRGSESPLGKECRCSVNLHKATLSYTKEGFALALTDSMPIGKGVGTWNIEKRMGEGVTLSLLYTLTSDR